MAKRSRRWVTSLSLRPVGTVPAQILFPVPMLPHQALPSWGRGFPSRSPTASSARLARSQPWRVESWGPLCLRRRKWVTNAQIALRSWFSQQRTSRLQSLTASSWSFLPGKCAFREYPTHIKVLMCSPDGLKMVSGEILFFWITVSVKLW